MSKPNPSTRRRTAPNPADRYGNDPAIRSRYKAMSTWKARKKTWGKNTQDHTRP